MSARFSIQLHAPLKLFLLQDFSYTYVLGNSEHNITQTLDSQLHYDTYLLR